eukprot:jgi/Mesen1/10096/ME000074S09443
MPPHESSCANCGNTLRICCAGGASAALTSPEPVPVAAEQQHAGIVVQWDVMNVTNATYNVLVRLTNGQRYTNVSSNPGWALQWTWQMNEMIVVCENCQTLVRGDCETCEACIDNPEVEAPYSCDPKPTLVDGVYSPSVPSLRPPPPPTLHAPPLYPPGTPCPQPRPALQLSCLPPRPPPHSLTCLLARLLGS